VVLITKYRRGVLVGEVALRMRQLIGEICAVEEVTMLKGHVSKEHVHQLVGWLLFAAALPGATAKSGRATEWFDRTAAPARHRRRDVPPRNNPRPVRPG